MRMIFLSSFLLSLLLCALSNKYDLDGLDFRLLVQESGQESQLEEETQLKEETQLEEENTFLLPIKLIGEDGENTMFFQLDDGFVIGDSSGPVGAIFDNGETSVDFGGGESSSPTFNNGESPSFTFNNGESPLPLAFNNGESPSPNLAGSTGLVNGVDEFTSLATSANYWSYELGPSLVSLDYDTNLPTNIWAAGGFLYIQALKQSFQGAQYTSASLSSQGKVSVQYGLFVIRAKFSYTKGVYPLYMLFSDDRSCGVVVMGGGISPNTTYSQVFIPSGSSPPANYTFPSGSTEDFHDYAVLWQPYRMDFYIDGVLYSSIDATSFGGQWPFDMIKMFGNVRLAVGGPSGNPDDSSVFPQQLVVDAVGIFQG